MAPSYTEAVDQVTDQYLTSLGSVQDQILESVSTFASKLPKTDSAPTFSVPAGVPTVEEINAASFAFIEKVVANQKAFADKFLQASKV